MRPLSTVVILKSHAADGNTKPILVILKATFMKIRLQTAIILKVKLAKPCLVDGHLELRFPPFAWCLATWKRRSDTSGSEAAGSLSNRAISPDIVRARN